MCMINHLAAGQNAVRSRNADIGGILEEKAVFPPTDHPLAYVGGGDGTMILDHEIVFVSLYLCLVLTIWVADRWGDTGQRRSQLPDRSQTRSHFVINPDRGVCEPLGSRSAFARDQVQPRLSVPWVLGGAHHVCAYVQV